MKPHVIRDEAMRQRIVDLLTALDLSRPWAVTIEPYRKQRSLSQNALMWSWLDDVAKHVSETTGYTPEEVHEHLKRKFLTPKRVEINGELTELYSTKALTTQQMTDYLDRIFAWATSELGLLLPHPADLGRTEP